MLKININLWLALLQRFPISTRGHNTSQNPSDWNKRSMGLAYLHMCNYVSLKT